LRHTLPFMEPGWTIDIDAVGDPADADDRYDEQLDAFERFLEPYGGAVAGSPRRFDRGGSAAVADRAVRDPHVRRGRGYRRTLNHRRNIRRVSAPSSRLHIRVRVADSFHDSGNDRVEEALDLVRQPLIARASGSMTETKSRRRMPIGIGSTPTASDRSAHGSQTAEERWTTSTRRS
jgi:hypothetical protein